MVKTITIHKCETCNSSYNTFDEAYGCENQKIEQPLAKVGDIVDYFEEGIPYWDSVDTHLTDLVIMEIKPNEYNPHHLEYVLGWESESGEFIEDFHARVESNAEFDKHCTVKDK